MSRDYTHTDIFRGPCIVFKNDERKRDTHEMRVLSGERDRIRGSGLATVKIHFSPSRSTRRAAPGRLDQFHLDSFRREFHLWVQSTSSWQRNCIWRGGRLVIHHETKSRLYPIFSWKFFHNAINPSAASVPFIKRFFFIEWNQYMILCLFSAPNSQLCLRLSGIIFRWAWVKKRNITNK